MEVDFLNRPLVVIAAALIAASAGAAVNAAPMTQADAAKALKGVYGTYSCGSGKTKHTSTFAPLFGGKAMSITESMGGGSESLVVFDAKRQKWINPYVDAQGNYSVMEGTPVKGGIDFKAVYPQGFNATMAVRMPSAKKMTTSMKMDMNGKMQTENETCTKM